MSRTELFAEWLSGNLVISNGLVTTGKIWWVHATVGVDEGGAGVSPDHPCATIDYAMGLCTVSKGDIIAVMPGHAEAIAAATSLVCDVAGVRIVGIGKGANQPVLTWTTAGTATILVTAAGVTFDNFKLVSNFATGITAGFTIAATATDFCIRNCRMTETVNTSEFLTWFAVAADADNMVVEDNYFQGLIGGTDIGVFTFAGGCDNLIMRRNHFYGDFSASIVDLLTADSTNLLITDNIGVNVDAAAGLGIQVKAASTGFANGNWMMLGKNDVVGVVGAGLAYGLNYYSNAVNTSMRFGPAVDA